MRAVSTVLDVSLFLLLVGAAATTLVWMPAETSVESDDPADETAELLATSTADVTYTIEPGLDLEESVTDGDVPFDPYERTVQDSVANLLGAAAVATAEFDGEPLMHHGDAFERRVVAETQSRVRQEDVTTAVRARWTPYPASPLSGTVRAGERPPPGVDVHAATVTVDSDMQNVTAEAWRAANEDGFAGLADVLANATIEGYLPHKGAQVSLRGGYPSRPLTVQRYWQVASALEYGADTQREPETVPPRADLEDRLADRFEADLRDRYGDPTTAAAAVRIDRVTITVRTWSR